MQTQKTLSRRTFLKASAFTVGSVVLAACAAPAGAPSSGGDGGGEASAEAVSLRLSAWADVQDAVVYENMVNAYHETVEGVEVSVEQYPGGYYEKIQANFAAGDSADILYMQGWQWQAYTENGVLVDLSDYISNDGVEAFFPGGENYDNQTLWQGGRYMTPTDTGALVVYYNKDLFDKQGVAYPEAGWKWEDFQQMILDLSHEDDGTKYYGWGQAQGWNGAYGRNTNFMRRNGHIEWDQITEPTTADWDHPDIASALQFLVYDAIANDWSPGPALIEGGGVGLDTGRVAMYLEGPWAMPRLQGELATTEEGINFDVVQAPTGSADRDFTFGHVHGHVITAPSENKDASWDVIKYILGEEGQTIIANGGRMCGTPDNIEGIWGSIAGETYNFSNTSAFADAMRTSSISCIFGEGSQIHAYGGGPVTVFWDKLLGQTETAEEALKIAQPEIQIQLDQYWADRA
ncbi:MAG: sugar ABC transporter substrate-binding protein [Chloroflexota bacterium]